MVGQRYSGRMRFGISEDDSVGPQMLVHRMKAYCKISGRRNEFTFSRYDPTTGGYIFRFRGAAIEINPHAMDDPVRIPDDPKKASTSRVAIIKIGEITRTKLERVNN